MCDKCSKRKGKNTKIDFNFIFLGFRLNFLRFKLNLKVSVVTINIVAFFTISNCCHVFAKTKMELKLPAIKATNRCFVAVNCRKLHGIFSSNKFKGPFSRRLSVIVRRVVFRMKTANVRFLRVVPSLCVS